MPNEQDRVLENLEGIIHQHTGVKITDRLRKKLLDYANKHYQKLGFNNELSFTESLLLKTVDSPEIKALITETTVAESYFYRHPSLLNFIRKEWLKKIVQERRAANDLSLRIWSAGSAAGQELYTIAMILLEEMVDLSQWNLHLIGTDIDTEAIAQARLACYGDWSFRGGVLPPEKYFHKENFHYALKEPVKKLAKFFYLNLIDDPYPSLSNETNNIDLILCCNVFIYLTDKNIKKILEQFANCLSKDGCILLAPSDFVKEVPESLEKYQAFGITYYKKKKEQKKKEDYVMSISPEKKQYESLLPVLFKQLNQEQWQSALSTIARCIELEGETALLLQFKSNALANLGDLDQALKLSDLSIQKNDSDSHTYLIKAMILLGLNRLGEAETALRQALLLNSDFVEVQFHLGLLLIRLNRWEEGVRLLRSASELIKKFDPERKVHHAPRLNFAQFSKIIENEIAAFENARKK